MGEPNRTCNLNDVLSFSVKSTQHSLRDTVHFDVVAVVTRIAVSSSPSSVAPFCQTPKVEVSLSDPSVPLGESITVVVFGVAESSRFALEKISHGDVLRFDRLVALQKQRIHNMLCYRKTTHFCLSHVDPNAGWSKLGYFDRISGALYMLGKQPVSFLTDIPETSLASWYLQWVDCSPSHLPPLPCTRRSLGEIESTNGLYSHIVVRIVSLDQRQTNIRDLFRSRRPFRFSPDSIIGFSIVEDKAGTRMTLLDPGNRFVDPFRKAFSSKVFLSLTNVLSDREGGLHGRPMASCETLLCTTQTTSVKEHIAHSDLSGSECTLNWDAKMKPEVCSSAVEESFVVVSHIVNVVVLENNLDTLLGSDSTFKLILGIYFGQQHPAPMFTLLHDGSTLDVAAEPSVVDTLVGNICHSVLEDQGADSVLWRHGIDLFKTLVSTQALLEWTITMYKNGALEASRVVLPNF